MYALLCWRMKAEELHPNEPWRVKNCYKVGTTMTSIRFSPNRVRTYLRSYFIRMGWLKPDENEEASSNNEQSNEPGSGNHQNDSPNYGQHQSSSGGWGGHSGSFRPGGHSQSHNRQQSYDSSQENSGEPKFTSTPGGSAGSTHQNDEFNEENMEEDLPPDTTLTGHGD